MKDKQRQLSLNPISNWYLVFLVGALSFLLVMIAPAAVAKDEAKSLASSMQASDKHAKAKGKSLDLSLFEGNVVMVEFWGSWCYQCAHSVAWLNGLSAKYADKGFTVLGVNLDSELYKAKRFEKKYPARFLNLYDPMWHYANYYKVENVPALLIFDRKGKLVHRHTGFKKGKAPAYEKLIDAIVKSNK